MTQVSRVPLRSDVWEKIFGIFLDTLLNIKGKERLNGFVQSLFTPTERIMFAKRLAAALLLAKGHSYLSVRKILHLFSPTIYKMNFSLEYEGQELNPILEDIMRRQAKEVFAGEVKDLLELKVNSNNL